MHVTNTFCAIFNPLYIAPPIKDHLQADDFHMVVYPSSSPESRLGCSSPIESGETLQGRALILDRGNCSFYRKALTAQSADVAMLVVVYDSDQLVNFPYFSLPERKATDLDITIPVLYMLQTSGQQLKVTSEKMVEGHFLNVTLLLQDWLSNSSEVHINAHVKSGPGYNLTPLLMFCLAMATVLMSAFLANAPIKFLKYA